MTGKIASASGYEWLVFFCADHTSLSRRAALPSSMRPGAAGHIDGNSRQVDMSDEAGSVDAEYFDDARDELCASQKQTIRKAVGTVPGAGRDSSQ